MKPTVKTRLLILITMVVTMPAASQVGIGTTTPNSTLDVRGALSLNYRSFTGSTQIGNTDNTVVFTGTSAATAILPDAATCQGRIYHIKNASTESSTPVLTVTAQPGQGIDGFSSWTLENPNESISVMSNGSGWYISGQHTSDPLIANWSIGGNGVPSEKRIGTISNYALPFITANQERMRITADGRLGIGLTSPATESHILSGTAGSGIQYTYVKGLTITSNGTYGFGGPGFYLENTDNPAGKKLFKINFTANGGSDSYINYQAVSDNGGANINANILTVMHSGRVGIGTATFHNTQPEKLLVEAGYTNSINVIGARGALNNGLRMNIQNTHSGSNASSNIVATADNGNEALNNISIGINSGSFTGSGTLGGANKAYLVARGNDFAIGNATAGMDLIFFTGGCNAANERVRINANGLVPGADNTYSLGMNGNRWSEVWSANGLIQTSDRRLKTDIQDLSYGLNELMRLRPVAYRWKEQPNSSKLGLIAQEVRKVIPEVVSGDEESEALGMNYAELVPLLINAVKELKQEVDELKKQLSKKLQ